MSKIQEKLNSLRPHVIGIRYIQGVQLVDAILKEGWVVPESKFIQVERVEAEDNYYMFFSDREDVDIDDLLEYVQEIINLNVEREKKFELLKLKVGELKKIFKDNTLTKLQRLKFTFSDLDVLPSLMDMDIITEEYNEPDNVTEKEEIKVTEKEENHKVIRTSEEQTKQTTLLTIKNNDIELPPKGKKIELEEFIEPMVVCKCGRDEVCPACETEKDLAY
jgi:hypothetical protein